MNSSHEFAVLIVELWDSMDNLGLSDHEKVVAMDSVVAGISLALLGIPKELVIQIMVSGMPEDIAV